MRLESHSIQPIHLLTQLSEAKATGLLSVTDRAVSWLLILEKGKLKQALSSTQSLSQLDYHLRSLGNEAAVTVAKTFFNQSVKPECSTAQPSVETGLFIQAIRYLKAEGYLSVGQLSQLVQDITNEAFESLLWLRQGTHQWLDGAVMNSLENINMLAPVLDIPTLIQPSLQRLSNWQQCSPTITSPHQRPYVLDHRLIQQSVPTGKLTPASLEKLSKLMRGISIRQLALFLKQDELKVAQMLYPYIKHGVICLRSPQEPLDQLPVIPPAVSQPFNAGSGGNRESVKRNYRIVCIDDSPTILDEMQRFLKSDKFQVTAIDDPIKASSLIFRIKPDLILMDITMPGINGYKLCSLLRNSTAFEKTPIIMVTGNKGLIDKARAKLAGSTDYLTKPFSKEELTVIVEQYLEKSD